MAMQAYVWLCRAMQGYVGLIRAMQGFVWLCMAMQVYVGLCWAIYGYVGLCRATQGCVWPCRAMQGCVKPFRALRFLFILVLGAGAGCCFFILGAGIGLYTVLIVGHLFLVQELKSFFMEQEQGDQLLPAFFLVQEQGDQLHSFIHFILPLTRNTTTVYRNTLKILQYSTKLFTRSNVVKARKPIQKPGVYKLQASWNYRVNHTS